jgi:hypothetical protein
MSKANELFLEYPHINMSILSSYKEEERSITVNDNDKDLQPISFPLPKAPSPDLIENFGLPAEEQYFRRTEVPEKLRDLDFMYKNTLQLAKTSDRWTLDDVFHHLKINQSDFQEEIEFIKQEHERRLKGYWVYINGVPTYISGNHYFYLNYFELDIGLPEYRSRDRKFFLFSDFCENDPDCMGFVYPKHRREGATYKAQCINICTLMKHRRRKTGIQSMTEDHAEEVFLTKLVDPWRELPFFMMMSWDGQREPKSKLNFTIQTGGVYDNKKRTIPTRNVADYKPSKANAYDGGKLIFYHQDEIGKSKDVDINERFQIVSKCLTQGPKIHGHSIHTSTVGEYGKGGGRNMERFVKSANYHKRNKSGRTANGLYTLFIGAHDGLENFIDQFGNSVIDEPTDVQKKYLIKVNPELKRMYLSGIGSREYLLTTREHLKETDFAKYAEEVRLFPMELRECFRAGSKDSGLNVAKIDDRLDELRFDDDKTKTTRGNFEFVDVGKTRVRFNPDPEGRFEISLELKPGEANRMFFDPILKAYAPLQPRFTAGADPFKFNKTEGNRKSDGGGAVFFKHDMTIDPPTKPIKDWKTHRFVCVYSHRVDDKMVYAEDMLAMCVYYGAIMYPEIDVPLIMDYFQEKGYGGFLHYKYDESQKRWKTNPGDTSSAKTKQLIFAEYMQYIEHHAFREVHRIILEQCRDIAGPEEMTDYDAFTAGGYALMSAKSTQDTRQEKSNSYNIEDYLG